jgi:hypothetical protein
MSINEAFENIVLRRKDHEARIQHLEALEEAAGSAGVDVDEDGVNVVAAADTLDFKDFNIEDLGGGTAGIWHRLPFVACGRLTLTSNTPVTVSDVNAATTLYYTPYIGEQISLWDGTRWRIYEFAELNIAVPATTNQMYDVFVYDNAGALTLELTAWTNDTTRATALAYQDEILIRSGAATRRYLGSFRTTGVSGRTEDSEDARFVWNYYHRLPRELKKIEATDWWSYSTAAWRSANGSTANRVEVVVGVQEAMMLLRVRGMFANSVAAGFGLSGIAINATNTNNADQTEFSFNLSSGGVPHGAWLFLPPAIGYSYYQWTEYASTLGAGTFYSTSGVLRANGLNGYIWG